MNIKIDNTFKTTPTPDGVTAPEGPPIIYKGRKQMRDFIFVCNMVQARSACNGKRCNRCVSLIVVGRDFHE